MATRRSADTPAPTEPVARRAPAPRTAAPHAKTTRPSGRQTASVSPEDRRAMIAENAYLRAERRGFVPGHEEADWLAAELEVDALLELRYGGPAQ